MISFLPLASKVFMFALLAVPGFVLQKKDLISQSALTSFTNILMYVAMPFLVFNKLCETNLLLLGAFDLFFCLIFTVFAVFFAFFLSRFLFKKRSQNRSRVAVFCATFSNCGFLGIPLTAYLFPESPQITVFISIYNVVSTFLLLTLGVYSLSGDKKHVNFFKACVSPVGIAVVLGVVVSLSGLGEKMPWMGEYSSILASLTLPLSMIVLGSELSKISFKSMLLEKDVYLCSVFKLVLLPMVTILILFCLKLFGVVLSAPLMSAAVIATALSTAASASAMAKKYSLDSEYASSLTLSNTLLCALTFPLLYLLAVRFLGL